MIRTLVGADSPSDRALLRRLLREAPGIEFVAESALAGLPRLVTEFGADALVEFREGDPGRVRLPTVSLVEDPASAWAARAAEVATGEGFAILPRDAEADEICAAVGAVVAGLAAARPSALVEAPARLVAVPAGPERLSPREVDVLAELARGSGNKQIAARLRISEHTVKFHVGSIFAKLDVSSRTQAVTQGVRLGLIML
jgi:DNA-binding NarL/FixJ family response regulator